MTKPDIFKMAKGSLRRRKHDPKGDEVRVRVMVDWLDKPMLVHTFKDLATARPFMNAANQHKDAKVILDFGDGTNMTLRQGKVYK